MSSSFSLLANAIPTFTKQTTVEAKVDQLADYQVQLLDFLRYSLHNLDAENFNETGLTEILKPVVAEIKNAEGDIATLKLTAEGLTSSVESLGDDLGEFENWTEGQVESLSSNITQTASMIRSEVTAKINTVNGDIETLSSNITQTEEKIAAVVSSVGDSSGNLTAASIVAAINKAGSSVRISADHISLSGVVTVEDLAGEGSVEINAGNIAAGGEIRAVTFVATGDLDSTGNYVVVENASGVEIGGIGYGYFPDDGAMDDKLYLRTEKYLDWDGYHYPSIKLYSDGNISLEAPQGDIIYLQCYRKIQLNAGIIEIIDNHAGGQAVWQFMDGGLYKNGTKVM